jgi:hypothetical protein
VIKQVPCRNRVTGATAELPETALRHLPNWLPIAENPADEQADDAADTAASDAADTAASDTEAERPQAEGRRRGQD